MQPELFAGAAMDAGTDADNGTSVECAGASAKGTPAKGISAPAKPSRVYSAEEARIMREIAAVFRSAGYVVTRINSGAMRRSMRYIRFYIIYGLNASEGFPDLIAFRGDGIRSELVPIEVKVPGEPLRESQVRVIEYFKRHGVPVHVLDNWRDAQRLVESFRQAA